MGRIGWSLIGVGFLFGSVALAQTPLNERRFYPEELREDVETIRRAVHHLHPDAYRYLPKAALDLRFDSLEAALSVPVTTTVSDASAATDGGGLRRAPLRPRLELQRVRRLQRRRRRRGR